MLPVSTSIPGSFNAVDCNRHKIYCLKIVMMKKLQCSPDINLFHRIVHELAYNFEI